MAQPSATSPAVPFGLRLARGEGGAAMGLLRAALTPASWLYAGAMAARRRAYHGGLLRSHEMDAPVISVGNLTCGGTGKTPMTAWLARFLVECGRKPAILSRGYRGERTKEGIANDEARLLARLAPQAAQYPDPDRVAAGRRAIADGADCLLLDDGFQHLRVRRGLNVLLIDAIQGFGGRALPAGLRREALSSVADGEAILLTRTGAVANEMVERLRARLGRLAPGRPVFLTDHRPARLVSLDGADEEPVEALAGRRVFLFCGIGNPEGFFHTVRSLGAAVAGSRVFADHYHYTRADAGSLEKARASCGAEMALTTEKDAVKLPGLWNGAPARALRVEMAFRAEEEEFKRMVRAALR